MTGASGYQLNREPYHLAILGDGALAIAFPMLIVAFVVVLVSTSLFPDDLDCRVLLTVAGFETRHVCEQGARSLALCGPLRRCCACGDDTARSVLMWNSRWSDKALLTRLVAHGAASLGASVVTALVIIATAGVLLVCVPRSRLRVG